MHIITPHRRGAGYFVNNVATARKQEADVVQCKHCERVVMLQKWQQVDGGFCRNCMAPVCGPCADRMLTYGCEPALKRIEQAFELGEKYRQFCKIAGVDPPPQTTTILRNTGGR